MSFFYAGKPLLTILVDCDVFRLIILISLCQQNWNLDRW